MIKKYLSGRVLVLIDAANLEKALKELGWHMDYKKLYWYFNNYSNLQRIIYYTANFNTPCHNNFLAKLKKIGIGLNTKEIKTIKSADGPPIRKANFDVEISADAKDLADKYDTLVLFSGDSDFEYIIEQLKRKNKNVIVVSSKYHISKELIRCSNKYIELKKLESDFRREGFEIKKPIFFNGRLMTAYIRFI